MIKILTNTVTNEFYDETGAPFQDGLPNIPFLNTDDVVWQLYTSTPNAGTENPDIENTWIKDTRYAGITTMGALLSADNNFTHKIQGLLETPLTSGAITSVRVNTTEDAENIPNSGSLKLHYTDGSIESVDYTARVAFTGGYEFTCNTTITNSYAIDSQVDIPEALYAQAVMDEIESDPSTGLFYFTITADSDKLREKLDYSDTREADDLKGLELLVFSTDLSDVITQRGQWLLTSFMIPNSIADLGQTSVISTEQENETLAIVNAALSGKVDKDLTSDVNYAPITSPSGLEKLFADNAASSKITLNTIKTWIESGLDTVYLKKLYSSYANKTSLSSIDTLAINDSSDSFNPKEITIENLSAYIQAGLLDDRGNYDASTNLFPSTGGSGTGGAILKGDIWYISVAGTIGGDSVNVGDNVRALSDSPGQTASNWSILEGNLGYVPENIANKATDFSTVNDTLYPTTGAVKEELEKLQHVGSVWFCPPLLSINSGDNTLFDISAGIGAIYNYDCVSPSWVIVNYAGATGVTPAYLLTSPASNISIDQAGAIVQSTTLPSAQGRRTNLYIGALIHTNLTNLSAVQNEPTVDYDDSNTLRDLALAIGIINYDGNIFSANGANLNIDKSAGTFFRYYANYDVSATNPNLVGSSSLVPASFLRGYYNGTNWVYDTVTTTTVPVTQYNDITTGLVAVSPNNFIILNIFVFPGTDNVIVHFGQKQYSTLLGAETGLTDSVLYDPALIDSSFRCRLIVKTNATDLSDSAQAKFVETDKFGQLTIGGGGGGGGEINTASNVGVGTGWFYQKSGVDLQFKSAKSTDGSIVITSDTLENDIELADTIPGTKTFSNFPVTPSSAPTTDYQVANKKYVDDLAGEGITGTFTNTEVQADDSPNAPPGWIAVAHTYGLWYPSGFNIWDNNNEKITDPDKVITSNNLIQIDLSSFGTITGTWRYAAGNAVSSGESVGGGYSNFFTAEDINLSFNETFWAVSARPLYDADITGTGFLRFDYAVAEYGGQVSLKQIPTGATNLVFNIKTRPFSTGATGTNFGWSIKYIIIRDGATTTTPATQILGTTAFETTGAGDTTATYTLALSTISAQAGDCVTFLLYPHVSASSPKQTDWMFLNMEVTAS